LSSSSSAGPRPLQHERLVAVDAVLHACRVCRTVQARLVEGSTLQKGDKSPVTVADFAAQAVVSHIIGKDFPLIPLVGEEDAAALSSAEHAALRIEVLAAVESVLPGLSQDDVMEAIDRGSYAGGPSGRHWTLDPIDGTKGFLRLDQYAVALALIEDGQVVLGVLGCPSLPHDVHHPERGHGSVFTAVKGHGTWVRTLDDPTEHRVRVSEVAQVSQARFCESVERAHSNQSDSARVAELLGIETAPFRIDSQCKYASVSRGDASIYLRLPTKPGYVERIWDHAAGVAVVTEAGGRVTDTRGQPLDFSRGRGLDNNKGVVATNGRFHDQVVDAVRTVLGV